MSRDVPDEPGAGVSTGPWFPDTNVYSFDRIPNRRDLFLVGSSQLETLRREWARYLAEPDGTTPTHPNEALNFTWCSVESNADDSCDLNVCIDMMQRYHGTVRKLPRSKFVTCVHFWNYQKRPYLVVDQDWFDEIQQALYSLYALVDAIGIRKALESKDGLAPDRIAALKARLDKIAAAHHDHVFFTFADSVIIKTNWSARPEEYAISYRPESFLDVVEQVRAAFAECLSMNSYAVVTQGANHFRQPNAVEVSPTGNHIFLGSLGVPFANLMEIDEAARMAIREKVHPATNLYLAASFSASLRFKSYEEKDKLRLRMAEFPSKVGSVGPSAYLPINAEELLPLLVRTGLGMASNHLPEVMPE